MDFTENSQRPLVYQNVVFSIASSSVHSTQFNVTHSFVDIELMTAETVRDVAVGVTRWTPIDGSILDIAMRYAGRRINSR